MTFLSHFNEVVTCRYTHLRAGKTGRREANLALVLVCIVVVFVLCHIPR